MREDEKNTSEQLEANSSGQKHTETGAVSDFSTGRRLAFTFRLGASEVASGACTIGGCNTMGPIPEQVTKERWQLEENKLLARAHTPAQRSEPHLLPQASDLRKFFLRINILCPQLQLKFLC